MGGGGRPGRLGRLDWVGSSSIWVAIVVGGAVRFLCFQETEVVFACWNGCCETRMIPDWVRFWIAVEICV